jgi:siroheme synthase
MPGRDYRELAHSWLSAGDAPELPCCVVSRAAQPDQHVQWTTLGEIANQPSVAAPSLLLAGWALKQRMLEAREPALNAIQQIGASQLEVTEENFDGRT